MYHVCHVRGSPPRMYGRGGVRPRRGPATIHLLVGHKSPREMHGGGEVFFCLWFNMGTLPSSSVFVPPWWFGVVWIWM